MVRNCPDGKITKLDQDGALKIMRFNEKSSIR